MISAILIVLGLAAAAVLLTWWSMAFPVMILEGRGISASLERSRQLVRGHVLRVLGFLLMTLVIVGVVKMMLSLPFTLLGVVILIVVNDAGPGLLLIAQTSITVGDVVTGMVLYPFIAAVIALLYLDLRIRHEGLDVELISAQQEAG
jgi:tellurite resistance protein TehA-like permease